MPHRRFVSLLVLALLLPALPARGADTRAFVLTTDFASGGLSAVNLTTRAVAQDVATVHSDAVMRWHEGLLYVVNRLGQDNIQVIDPAQNYATIHQFSVGNGSNPQDIALVSPTRGYVSRLGTPSLLIVNPVTGVTLGTIDLAAFADADGNPEAARMQRVGPYLFVALQRLTNFQPAGTSLVAVVDTRADTLVDADPSVPGTQAITLAATNPSTTFAYDAEGRRLLIGCPGAYGVADGGIDAISLDDLAPTSSGLVITEAALGGDVVELVWNGAAHSYAIVSDAGFNTSLVAWSAVSHTVTDTVYAPGGFSLADAELNDRGELYVCNNSFAAPGLFVFAAGPDTPLAGPLDTGLPPFQVVFDHAATVAGVAPGPVAGLALSAPTPNPARGFTQFAFIPAGPGEVEVNVFDLAGRRVRTLLREVVAPHIHPVTWSLDDDAGRPLRSGVYIVRARQGAEVVAKKIVVAR